MNVCLCGGSIREKESIAAILATVRHEALYPERNGSRLSKHEGDSPSDVQHQHGTEAERNIYIIEEEQPPAHVPHPNFTVLLHSGNLHPTSIGTHKKTKWDTRLNGMSGSHRTQPSMPSSGSHTPLDHYSYNPRYDLVVDARSVCPAKAAQIIAREADSFSDECRLGTIGPFRNDFFFLSNMFPSPVQFDDIVYSCSECAYQAQKTEDLTLRRDISQFDGKAAKMIMRSILPRPEWGSVCVDVMEQVLLAKFTQNQYLQRALCETSGLYLVEYNDWGDDFYGVVLRSDGAVGHGLNMLGKTLMRVRKSLCS